MNLHSIILLLLIVLSNSAKADSMIRNDAWHGKDKDKHFIVGMIIGGVVTKFTQNTTYGIISGCGIGLLKEISDMNNNKGESSVQDAIVTCVGAYVGSKLIPDLYLTHNKIIYKIYF